MMRTHNLLAFLSLTSALLAVQPAQAAFEFIAPAKAPAAAPAPVATPTPVPVAKDVTPAPVRLAAPVSMTSAPAPAPVAKALPTPVSAPAMVPVTKVTTPEEDVAIAIARAPSPTPVWTPKAPVVAKSNSIPLTPIVSADNSSLQVLDGPLLPGLSDEPVVKAPVMPAPVATAPVKKQAGHSILWDKPQDAAPEKDKPFAIMPVLDDVAEKQTAPAPIVETILETPQVAAVAPADDKVVEGFGSGIPLAIALRQVVPPYYRFSFGPGVDAGQRVSWQGGKPWSQIISDMAAKQGMQAEIAGNVVALRRGGSVAVARGSMMEDVVLGGISPAAASAASPTARTVLSTTTESNTTAFKPVPMMDPVKPAQDAPVSLLASVSDAPSPIVNRSIDVVDTKPASPVMPKALPPIMEETVVASKPLPLPVPDMADDVISPMASKKADVKTASDLTASQEWIARSGSTLRSILQDWSRQANVSLVWSSDFDYPLQTDIRIQGAYPDAVRTLLAGFGKAQPKPVGRLHKNSNLGAQPVLIIETPRLING